MDSDFAFRSFRVYYTGVQMGRKKNKKKISPKGFPGHDLHLTIAIVVGLGILTLIKACR
jgi:hypothetical protein